MSPLDASFLHIEDGVTHMHIASLALFEGPPPPIDELRRLFEGKLPLVPRYRQKVRFVPGSIGRPVWVDDPHFKIEYHLRHTALPSPGGDAELKALVGRLMSQELDRHRPLWETWMVEGVSDHRWALISKVHHCMVDGVSGTDLMALILDHDRTPSPPEPDNWSPSPEPNDLQLVAHALGDLFRNPYEQARALRARARDRQALVDLVRNTAQGLQMWSKRIAPTPKVSIEGPIGPHRRWTWTTVSLDDIKRIRKTHGGTHNDVVLSVISQGFRDLLIGRGDEPKQVVLRSLVPVSVRAGDDHTPNNQVSAMIAELPVGIADPIERLGAVKAQMQELKHSHQAVATDMVNQVVVGFTPPMLFALSLRAATTALRRTSQRSVNTVTTNVPGPNYPLYACGCEMTDYLPYVPVSHGVTVGVAILTYNGRTSFGITGDWDSAPDIERVAEGIRAGIDELLTLS